jgi:hypothetical protein
MALLEPHSLHGDKSPGFSQRFLRTITAFKLIPMAVIGVLKNNLEKENDLLGRASCRDYRLEACPTNLHHDPILIDYGTKLLRTTLGPHSREEQMLTG